MTMTRQDFELIARVLSGCTRLVANEAESELFDYIVQEFALALAGTNPRFDRDKFLRAAGTR